MKRAAGSGHRILESLFERPIISVATAQNHLGLTFAGANNVISSLERLGILREITGQAIAVAGASAATPCCGGGSISRR